MPLHFEGILVGAAALLLIGIFHPIVIWCEYYFSKKIWPAFFTAAQDLSSLLSWRKDCARCFWASWASPACGASKNCTSRRSAFIKVGFPPIPNGTQPKSATKKKRTIPNGSVLFSFCIPNASVQNVAQKRQNAPSNKTSQKRCFTLEFAQLAKSHCMKMERFRRCMRNRSIVLLFCMDFVFSGFSLE